MGIPAFKEFQVCSQRTVESARSHDSGVLTWRSPRFGRGLTAFGVVLSVLLGSVVAAAAPAGATPPSFPVVATASLPSITWDMAVSPDGSRLYATHNGPFPVSVIDTETNTVVDTVDVGLGALGVAVSPDGSRLYVTNNVNGSVSVIDTETNTVVDTVVVGGGPWGVAVSPDGSRLYVASPGGGWVSVIDTATYSVETVSVGGAPERLAVTPDGSRVYVTDFGGGSVSVIDTETNTVVDTVPTTDAGSYAYDIAVSPDGSRVYVTFTDNGFMCVIDTETNTVVDTVPVVGGGGNTGFTYGLAVSPDGTLIYVVDMFGRSVNVFDAATSTLRETVPVGVFFGLPRGLAVSPDGSRVYVGNWGDLSVTVIAATPPAPISLDVTPGDGSASIAFTPVDGGGAEITNYEYQLNGTGSWVAFSPAETSSPLSISGLTNGTAYTVKLRAVNSAGPGAASVASASFTPRTRPSTPTSLVATAGVNSASIAFTAGSDGGSAITKYQYRVGNGSWTDAVGTTSPITISGLTNYVNSEVRLRAVNAVGNSAASSPVSVRPRQAGPAVSAASPSGRTGIVVTFDLNPLPGTTVAYQSVVAYERGTSTARGSCRTYGKQRTCYIGGLTPATNYDLRVTAHLPVVVKTWRYETFEGSILQVRTNN